MATSGPSNTYSFTAAEDLSAKQYYAVSLGSSGVSCATVAGQKCVGLVQNDPASGAAASVAISGIASGKAGGTIAVGDLLTPTSAGKLVASLNVDDFIVGVALAAASSDEVLSVLVTGERKGAASTICIPVTLANVANGDLVAALPLGFGGRISKISFLVTSAVTTASKAATLTPKIGSTALTGGVLSLTSANCTPIGTVVAATAITALNTFVSTDTITITASSVTAFVEGEGVLVISLR